MDLALVQLSKIEARKETRFKDPYIYNPNLDEEGLASPANEEPAKSVIPSQQPLPNFKYAIGAMVKDTDGGDGGVLPKKGRYFPQVHLIRSKYCSGGDSTNRQVKEAYMTTGIVLAYTNQFDVVVYNIQKPSKEGILPDFSKDYFDKIITQKKLN